MAIAIYYVCDKSGNNNNNGSLEYPFKTIQYASDIAKPGDTILVQPGIYREHVIPPIGGITRMPITYKSVIQHAAIISGSQSWTHTNMYNLKKSNIYYGPIIDLSNETHPFKIPFLLTPYGRNGKSIMYTLGQVFVNDMMYTQYPSRAEMESIANTWFYDISINRLFVNIPTTTINSKIEITNKRRLFSPNVRGLTNIIVDGFVIERCGNNYPYKFSEDSQQQHTGAIGTNMGRFWTIKNNIIRYATGIGLDFGNQPGKENILNSNGHIIHNNIISDNGAVGAAAYMCKNFMFSCNTLERNNNLHFILNEASALLLHFPKNSLILYNKIQNNYCKSIHCKNIYSSEWSDRKNIMKNNVIMKNNDLNKQDIKK